MASKTIFYAQSGGVTSVINTTAAAVIETQRRTGLFSDVIIGRNGILGLLEEQLLSANTLSDDTVQQLAYTPSGAFGSCRYALPNPEDKPEVYAHLFNVLQAHNVGLFLYNGGGDSQDTTAKMQRYAQAQGIDILCIGLPKTIDNDLPFTDVSPGFGSAAKYIAISTLEASLDVKAMAKTSTKVFVLEVMGRHAGWLAASAALMKTQEEAPPHLVLLPEYPVDRAQFLAQVQKTVDSQGYCVIVASEGIKDTQGHFISAVGSKDAFGHVQLGGVAATLCHWVQESLKLKYHYAICDYLQRAASHIASATDRRIAYDLGRYAVEIAAQGVTGIMPCIERLADSPFRYQITHVDVAHVANVEKPLPADYWDQERMMLTPQGHAYFRPYLEGEAYPPYHQGLPCYWSGPSEEDWQALQAKK